MNDEFINVEDSENNDEINGEVNNGVDVLDLILSEKDPTKLNNLVDIFNANQAKKNVIRSSKYSDILDYISNEASNRILNSPDSFSNGDLLDWITALQNILNKEEKSVPETTKLINAAINIQNNQVNVNAEDTLSKESKEKILETIKAIMQNNNKELNDTEDDKL